MEERRGRESRSAERIPTVERVSSSRSGNLVFPGEISYPECLGAYGISGLGSSDTRPLLLISYIPHLSIADILDNHLYSPSPTVSTTPATNPFSAIARVRARAWDIP